MLSPEALQCVITGLMKFREVEGDETYRLIFGSKDVHSSPAKLPFV